MRYAILNTSTGRPAAILYRRTDAVAMTAHLNESAQRDGRTERYLLIDLAEEYPEHAAGSEE